LFATALHKKVVQTLKNKAFEHFVIKIYLCFTCFDLERSKVYFKTENVIIKGIGKETPIPFLCFVK
jgi:hypothetical protein